MPVVVDVAHSDVSDEADGRLLAAGGHCGGDVRYEYDARYDPKSINLPGLGLGIFEGRCLTSAAALIVSQSGFWCCRRRAVPPLIAQQSIEHVIKHRWVEALGIAGQNEFSAPLRLRDE